MKNLNIVIKPIIDQSVFYHYYRTYLKKYEQLYDYMEKFLSELLCGFRKAHSTQHTLFGILQVELHSGGCIGTVLMDLSKAYGHLSQDLLIAKLEAYGLDIGNLNFGQLSLRNHRTKVGFSYSKKSEICRRISQGYNRPVIFINGIFLFCRKIRNL